VCRRPLAPGQWTSRAFTDALTAAGIAGSIASLGDALNNALMEPTIGPYKSILIDRLRPRIGQAAVERETAAWIRGFNTERLHRPPPTGKVRSTLS